MDQMLQQIGCEWCVQALDTMMQGGQVCGMARYHVSHILAAAVSWLAWIYPETSHSRLYCEARGFWTLGSAPGISSHQITISKGNLAMRMGNTAGPPCLQ